MSKLASHFIAGILIVTSLCAGAFEVSMQAHASNPNDKMLHGMEHEGVSCCEGHEQKPGFMNKVLQKEERTTLTLENLAKLNQGQDFSELQNREKDSASENYKKIKRCPYLENVVLLE